MFIIFVIFIIIEIQYNNRNSEITVPIIHSRKLIYYFKIIF